VDATNIKEIYCWTHLTSLSMKKIKIILINCNFIVQTGINLDIQKPTDPRWTHLSFNWATTEKKVFQLLLALKSPDMPTFRFINETKIHWNSNNIDSILKHQKTHFFWCLSHLFPFGCEFCQKKWTLKIIPLYNCPKLMTNWSWNFLDFSNYIVII